MPPESILDLSQAPAIPYTAGAVNTPPAPASIPALLPETIQANTRHLYAEIVWMGFAFAMEWYYLQVYAIRLGANALQLAVLTAGRALLMVIGAALAQRWERRHSGPIPALFWPLFLTRLLLYLGIALAPFLATHQVDALVGLVALSAIPTGASQGIFLGMMPRAVPKANLARVVARRAVLLNIGILPCILLLSQFLQWFPQPLNYQIGFGLAFGVSLMSTWHISRIRTTQPLPAHLAPPPINVWADPRFRRFLLITLANQVSVFMAASLNGLQLVRGLNAPDSWISIFGVCEMLAGVAMTFRLDWLMAHFGTRRLIVFACAAVTFQTLILAFTPILSPFIIGSLLFGAGWFSVNALLYNLLVELFPGDGLAAYAAAFQLVINASSFIGPLLGTLLILAGVSLPAALLLITGLRLVAILLAVTVRIAPAS